MHAVNLDLAIGALMSSPVRTLTGDTSALEALELAKQAGIHHFPIVENGRVTGLVCTCDLEDIALTAPVRSAIHRSPVALDGREPAAAALDRMRKDLVGSVIVTREDRAVGIVTREDLCRVGLDAADSPNFHCDSCGAVTHLKREGTKGVLCLDCRSHSNPESPNDETGVVD